MESDANEKMETGSRTSATTYSDPTPAPRSKFRSIVLVLTVSFAMLINTANNTASSIALPTIGREMHLDESQLQWMVSAYSLTSGCLLLVFGRLADLYGRKKAYLFGSFWLASFTLGCGFANDITTLSILRGLQGAGAAACIPASLGILAHAFPPSPARSMAFATFAAGAPLGAVFGTAIGGVLTEFTVKSWRSPFYFQSGMSALCFICGLLSIDGDVLSTGVDRRVDWIGALLVTAGLVLIVFVLGQGEIAPQKWATPYIIALLILGIIFIALFLFWQRHLERMQSLPSSRESFFTPPPLMKLSLWSRQQGKFAAVMAIAFSNWCAFLAWTFWVQLYYQDFKHYSAIQTVVRLLPMFVSGILCNTFVGMMAARVPMIYLMVVGAMGTSGACLLFALIAPSASFWAYGFPAAVISVIGCDFVYSAGTLFIAKISLPHEQSVSGALFQTMTQLGTAVGVTTSTVVFNRVTIQHGGADMLKSYQAAQWTNFAFGCIVIILAATFFRGVGVVGHRKGKQEYTDPERTVTNSRLAFDDTKDVKEPKIKTSEAKDLEEIKTESNVT